MGSGMDSGLVLRQYLEAVKLRSLEGLIDFWDFYSLIDDKQKGFLFSLARRIISLAIESSNLYKARRCLDRMKVHLQLTTAMFRHLDLWIDLDLPGRMGDYMFISEERFRGMLDRELQRLEPGDYGSLLHQVK